jgi:glycine betaine/proline transport system ATP-binding protein
MGMVFRHFRAAAASHRARQCRFPLEVQGVAKAARDEHAMKMIELAGPAGKEGFFPRALSGGQ